MHAPASQCWSCCRVLVFIYFVSSQLNLDLCVCCFDESLSKCSSREPNNLKSVKMALSLGFHLFRVRGLLEPG